MVPTQSPTADATASFSNHPAGPVAEQPVPAVAPAVRRRRNFASDNASGVCPEAWAAMADANAAGHLPSYGADRLHPARQRRLPQALPNRLRRLLRLQRHRR